MRCRGVHRLANPPFLSGFLCSGLLRVAPYCALSGIRVVSGGDGLSLFQHTWVVESSRGTGTDANVKISSRFEKGFR